MKKLKFERAKAMKKGFKKGLSVLVGVLMLISMMPIGVMAEEATAVNGALVNQSDENVDSQGGTALTPMPNSLTMLSANDPMVNGRNNILGEPVTAASGIDPTPQTVPQNLETTEAIQTSTAEGDFEYEAVAGGVSITRYTGPGGNVVIPSTLAGKKVVAIGYLSFYDCFSLTNITIPDSVTRIGSSAFRACSSLTSITIPDRVTTIGSYAFQDCSSLTTITIPDGVTSIGSSAFSGCFSLTNVTIPDRVTSIGDFAFMGCSSLTNIIIPDGVTSIDGAAFMGCSSLTTITIPDSVTTIGGWAFSGCSGLTSINVNSNNLNYSSLDGVLFDKAATTLIACPGAKVSITIPNSVTSIGSSAFSECSSLTNVTIPDSVTTIGSSAFSGCSSLTNVTIPDSVITIGSSAFYRCSSLTSINVNSNNLNYSSLDGVLFDKAVTTLILCPGGKVSITIPNSVTSIGDFAFSGSASLTSIIIPDSVTTIGASAFSGCSSLTNVTIPNSITRIGDSAFWGCSSLTNVTIPNGVTNIEFMAFYGCASLTNVTIPDSVTSIGAGAFYRCSSLISIQINSANTTIYDSADGRPDGWTIPVSATIIGHNPSTAKDFAASYNRTFIEIGADKRLKEIAITSPAQKLVYQVGEALDLTGLTVIGTYSDGTTQQMAFTSDNILGFDSSYPESSQVLTIAIEGITTTYTVQIIEANEPGQSGLTAFLLKDVNGNLYEYDQDSIHLSYVSFQTNPNLPNAKMYQHFSGILTSGGKVYGLKDGSKGYMDYEAAVTAYMIAQFSEQPFDMNAYLALDSSKKLIEPLQNIQVVDKNGNVTY